MSLEIDRRSYGSIYIIGCSGLIVVGDSLAKLEQALERALLDANRIVVDLSGVDRIDSTGMGLLVRFLSRLRNKGGDLRLSSPSQFVRKLLAATRLDSVFLVYTSDYNAIASFVLRGAPGENRGEFAATVLFLDQSHDLCAFVRSVLGQHGYEVLTTSRFRDAQLLAQAAQPSIILIGPKPAELENEAVVPVLQAAAPNAGTVTLPRDFGHSYANHGAAALLNAVKHSKRAGA
jgi:anti-sigma B factor antagonist